MSRPEEPPAAAGQFSSHGERGLTARHIGLVVNGDLVLPRSAVPPDAPAAPAAPAVALPSGTPTHWSVPPRNPSFTGRAELLAELHLRLGASTTAVVTAPQTLQGLGGVGKTQLALEYAHRYRDRYDLVWWIDAEQAALIPAALARLAQRIGLPVDADADPVGLLKDALRRGVPTSRWLLVFDNADAPEALRDFLPDGPGRTLVTSRNPGWTGLAEVLPVSVFTRAESVDHLCRRAAALTREDADHVAEAVGDLPLAVGIAAAWLTESGMPVSRYVEELRAGAARVLGADPLQRFDATWQVSIAQVRAQSPSAVRLLELCAFLAPEPIALDLFYSEGTSAALSRYGQGLDDPVTLGQALRTVGRYALARVDAGTRTVQLHRLVQAVIRNGMEPVEQETAMHLVHRLLVSARPPDGDADSTVNWPAFRLIWPHLTPSLALSCDEPETRELLLDRVRYLRRFLALDSAQRLAREVATRWRDRFAEDPDDSALQEQLLRMEHLLGTVLRSQGSYAEAYALDSTTHRAQVELLGERDPQALTTAVSLAADLRALGRSDEAAELREETFRSFREVVGPEDPRTLAIANSLARDLREIGDFRGSVEVLREVGAEDVGAPPYRAGRLRNTRSLAISLRRSGDPRGALEPALRAHEAYAGHYGRDSADALGCELDLAAAYGACGESERARELAERALTGHQRLFGREHVFTLVCENGLGIHLRACGAVGQAVLHGTRSVAGLREVAGPTHPHTLIAMVNLANSLAEQGETVRAAELGRAAYEGLAARHGAGHPDVFGCLSNRAVTLRTTDPERAVRLREEALAGLARVLGEEHPGTVACREWRWISRDLETQSV
ncbi:FxSxx-COOH system tetratricopeptide repeat protein [Kitasatospora sp. NPDC004289]